LHSQHLQVPFSGFGDTFYCFIAFYCGRSDFSPLRQLTDSPTESSTGGSQLFCSQIYHLNCDLEGIIIKTMKDISNLDWRHQFKRLEGAYAPSTMRAYYVDVTLFVNWCHEAGLCPFPAASETVCRFLQEQSAEKNVSTVRRRLYSIRKAHQLLGLADQTKTLDVDLTIRRIRRTKEGRPRQAKGLTRNYLDVT